MRDYPKVIEVQFHNRCNSNCLICPYKDMNYSPEIMDEYLFDKLISEIDEEKLVRLIPYLNNEPFLDRNFVNKIKKIREKYKKLEIEISTNASVINKEIISDLSKLNITELRISVFGFANDTYKRMMPNLNQDKVFNNLAIISEIFTETNTKVSIVMIDDGSIDEKEFIEMKELCENYKFSFERWGYLDRGDNVSYKSNDINNPKVSSCEQNRPLERMHILANGDIILCCQDWKHTIILGNIKSQTIKEIWNSDLYNNVRDSLYNKEKISPELCQKCKLGH